MNDYWKMATPSLLIFGEGKASKLPEVIDDLGYKQPYVVIDPKVMVSAKGTHIQSLLEKHKPKFFDKFSTNPTTDQVNALVKALRIYKPDLIIGIGGGSTIDLSKTANLTYTNGGVIEDYLNGKKSENHLLPMIFLPTTAGTGSEASPFAVIKDDIKKLKRGIENLEFLPKLVILDPEFLMSLDKVMVAATGIDAITHIMESFISRNANEITRSSAKGLLMDIIPSLEKAVFQDDVNSYLKMLNAAFASRLLYPRTGLTIAHALSHPLGAYTDIHHGLAVAFFLKDSMIYNQSASEDKLTDAVHLMGFDKIDSLYKWLDSFFVKSGIAQEIHGFMIDKNPPIETMAIDAMKSSNIPSNPKETSVGDLIQVINNSYKYWGLK